MSRTFAGKVVSDSPDKTVIVSVERSKTHKLYGKRFVVAKKYPVHDEKNQAEVGDVVSFFECAPRSKTKKWELKKILEKAEKNK